MVLAWVKAHRSLAATATSGSVVVALVAAAAIISTGFSAQRLDLNDASVWVANSTEQYIGRANTAVFELNTVVASTSNDVEVVQSGATVLLVDRSDAKLDIVDPARSQVEESIALPPNQPRVYIAGSNVAIYSQGTGELWITPIAELSHFNAEQVPNLNLGAGTLVSVDPGGMLFGFSADAGQVYRVDAANGSGVVETSKTGFGSKTGNFSITSVGGRWAVLESATGIMQTPSAVVNLGSAVGVANGLVLQAPSSAGTAVLIADSAELISVPFGAAPATLVSGRSGVAAAPSVVGDCEFAAWSDGSAWRRCASDPKAGTVLNLDEMPSGPRLEFQSNGDRMVLNDSRAGASWAVQSNGELIDNWDDLIAASAADKQDQKNDPTQPPETVQTQEPPIAIDDAFGARPGRANALPVLLNDYDANGDVLVVSKVEQPDPSIGRVDIINQAQELQLTLQPGASGHVVFGYTISDGRGGTDSAIVTVTVRAASENSAPIQVRQTRSAVVSGGQVAVDVLGDWVDPDGDPFYLASASVDSSGTVSHKADGGVIYSDRGAGGAPDKLITLVVSDGSADGVGTLTITVKPSGEVPIIADPFVVLAYSGVEVRIAPLDHVRGGNPNVRLNAVPPKNGVTIKPNFERGTFRFTSAVVGTHYLEYVVTDDVQTVTGVVRVDVAAPPDANTTPITVPKTIFVKSLSSQTIDVASTDYDPAGGVLLVTGVMNIPVGSGIRAEVLGQQAVRVTLFQPLTGPVTFNYRISNGLAEADGTITVIEIPQPEHLQPPIARDDTVTVRVGDAITIDVMANDEHPDGEAITLDPKLVDGLSGDSGLLFASGNTLRYLAPNHTGNFTATYQILGPFGQTAQAQVTIQVREPNVDTNHAPAPSRIVARVLAGEQVRIDVPLDGIDPDGDSVQLLGQETNPEKGAVLEVGSNYIVYEAGKYSAGTDTFTYALIDSLGARATGTIRVGISPKLPGARNPVAVEDEVHVRPGATVSVRVLANDSDPDGSPLTVTSVKPNGPAGGTTAKIIDGSIVSITASTREDRYGFVYEIANAVGGTSSNFITVTVSATAPLAYPVASDVVLNLADILDHDTVDVNVLSRVFFADGNANDLGVSLVPGFSSSEVLANKSIRVKIGNERQIIPFSVSHPDDETVRSYAFIWVPGYNDALPQIDRRAPKLQVNSESTLTIHLNDYVIAVGGKQVRLTDSSTVQATHANGDSLVVDGDTVQFTSADLYFGLASISFQVTDGSSATDPNGRKAILVLPINVLPRANQPPDFTGAAIDFEPGQQKVIDLVQLTNYPYQADRDELTYTVLPTPPVDFTYELNGQLLTITADNNAVKGSSTSITLGVRDAVQSGVTGRIELAVVPSTRPLARPAADDATTRRGTTTVVDVLANDDATNPFPGQPLKVLQVAGIDGGQLPTGVSVGLTENNSRITVTVASDANPVDLNLQYQVADATNDPARYVWGTVRIAIQDRPDTPAKPTRQATSFVGGELKLRITAPQPNNSPITNYRISSTSNGGYSYDCGIAVICTLPGLQVGSLYSFTVVATNLVGDSDPSAPSDPYSVDYRPAAPASVTAVPSPAASAPNGGSIDVTWDAVPNPPQGSAVSGYVVLVNGAIAAQVPVSEPTVKTIGGLANDVIYTVDVYATNGAQVLSDADWNRASTTVHTVGPPTPPTPAPQATSATNGTITVIWGASGSNGGGTVSYDIARVDGAAIPADCTAVAPIATGATSPWTDTTSVDGQTYTYFVYSKNGHYCTASSTGATISLVAPGQASGAASLVSRSSGQLDIRASSLSVSSGTAVKYQYLLSSDGNWRDVPADGWLTSLGGAGVSYGVAVDVSFRGCRNDSDAYCGDPSAITTLTPGNAQVTGLVCDATNNSAPIITQPANSGPVSVSYTVSYNTPLVVIDIWSSYGSSTDPVPSNATDIRVKATVNGYENPGYDQFTCNH